MRFFSDNAAAAHPAVLEAIVRANAPDTAYDGDMLSASLDTAFSALFEAPVRALCVASGTAANAIALATLCPPYRGIVCHREAHVQNDEAGAPEFYTHGAKLLLADGPGAKLTPETLVERLDAIEADVHRVQPAAVSITNATEYGQVYAPGEVAAIGMVARARGLRLHMDGARFANAVASSGATPAALTVAAGVDVLSFGFVKNGGLSAEALVYFDTALADEARIRLKRAGHLLSKGRFLAAQITALLAEDRWLANARAANRGAARIAQAAPARLLYPVEANEVFVRLTPDEAHALRKQECGFYDWGPGVARFVVSWDQPSHEIDRLVALLAAL